MILMFKAATAFVLWWPFACVYLDLIPVGMCSLGVIGEKYSSIITKTK